MGILCLKCWKNKLQLRLLSLQEHQSKQILHQNGCLVQNFFVTSTSEDAKIKFKQASRTFLRREIYSLIM